MSITTNLQRLVDAKSDIANAITAKGGTVNQGDGFEEFSADIASIPSGGGTRIVDLFPNLSTKKSMMPKFKKRKQIEFRNKEWHYSFTTETTDLTYTSGKYVWTDGEHIYRTAMINSSSYEYYSKNGYLPLYYIWDPSTITWRLTQMYFDEAIDVKMRYIYGYDVWTDGENIYYSNASSQYVFNKSTSTWSTKTWGDLTPIYGRRVWTDGENIYYSYSSNQYILNRATGTWESKTWSGLTSFDGLNVWTDGTDIYYSNAGSNYVLDKSTSTWSTKTWTGLTGFAGSNVWTDGDNIYCSTTSTSSNFCYFYIYKLSNDTWKVARSCSSSGTNNYYFYWTASYMWTDGINIYCDGTVSYKNIWSDGETMYYNNRILVFPDPDD